MNCSPSLQMQETMDQLLEQVITVVKTPAILQPTTMMEDSREEVLLVEDTEEVRDTRTTPIPTTVSLGPDLQPQEVVQEVQEVHLGHK